MPWGTGNLEKAASLGHIRPEGDPHVPVPKHCEWLLFADRVPDFENTAENRRDDNPCSRRAVIPVEAGDEKEVK